MRKVLIAGVLVMGGVLTGCGPLPPTGPDPVQCETERTTLETALEAYRADSGLGYPPSLDDLVGLFVKPGSITQSWDYSSTGAAYVLDGPC